MKDGYRYFVSYATGEDGLPVTSNDPSYFRCNNNFFGPVRYWIGHEWKESTISGVGAYFDDVLGSGATVRELLDEKDVPRKPAFLPPYQVPAEGQPAAFLPPYQEVQDV